MRVNANAVLRSWTLLAAFGGSYAPGTMYHSYESGDISNSDLAIILMILDVHI